MRAAAVVPPRRHRRDTESRGRMVRARRSLQPPSQLGDAGRQLRMVAIEEEPPRVIGRGLVIEGSAGAFVGARCLPFLEIDRRQLYSYRLDRNSVESGLRD